MRMSDLRWTHLIAVPFIAGCYAYVPANTHALAPATPISVELSPRGTLNVANKIGDNAMVLEGNVTDASASAVTLSLTAVRRRGENTVSTWNGESLTLTPDDINEVRRRELSRPRTAIASAALGAASVGLIVAIARATGTASGTVGGKPTPNP